MLQGPHIKPSTSLLCSVSGAAHPADTGRAAEPWAVSNPNPRLPHHPLPPAWAAATHSHTRVSASSLLTWSAWSSVCPSAVCECHLLAEIISRLCLTDKHLCFASNLRRQRARGQRALIEFFNVILIGSLLCASYFFPSLSFSVLCKAPLMPSGDTEFFSSFSKKKKSHTSINYCSRRISSLKDARFL